MRRRQFLSFVGGVTAWPFAALAAENTVAAPDGAVAPASWPNASSTGVPAGTTLKAVSGDLQSSADGQVIDACNVNGTIIVRHRDVTIRRTRALIIFVDPAGQAVTIEDCQVTGGPWNSGINLLSGRCVVRRCDISGVENGFWLEANQVRWLRMKELTPYIMTHGMRSNPR